MDSDAIPEDMKEKVYALFNSQTADVQGVSMADFGAVTTLVGAKIRELSA